MNILDDKYVIEMPDKSKWAIPVRLIAEHRARYYSSKDGVTFDQSLNEDTVPLFEDDHAAIHDWASNNMDWSDVEVEAEKLNDPVDVDYQEGWVNGEYEVHQS